ncbi:hypothetical protein DL768_003435 [Monosporascus sp. mg162]|nr:hypothetical protein DL768_003435 [Monosporascus sp. mg162]
MAAIALEPYGRLLGIRVAETGASHETVRAAAGPQEDGAVDDHLGQLERDPSRVAQDFIPETSKSSRGQVTRTEMEPSPEEHTARIIWVVHILSYLTKGRSHVGLEQLDANYEEEELDDGELDTTTERMACLSGSKESIRFKFLDCVAQLLSPSKGWDYVVATALREREDFVEIDVARNDCFGITGECWSTRGASDSGVAEEEYCRKLETYLSTVAQYDAKSWADFRDLLYQGAAKTAKFREQIVGSAYKCAISSEIRKFVHNNLQTTEGRKVWLHSEMQLFTQYENGAALPPTLNYFGCSKKACLLCESFLQALPRPVATRGRHGICYAAWGVPPSRSTGTTAALKELEKMLIFRARSHVLNQKPINKKLIAPAVNQSTVASACSDSVIQDLLQREERAESAKKAEKRLRERRHIQFREAALVDGSAINRSIPASVGASGTVPHPWCGPVIAMREMCSELYEDITLADFRHTLDYLMSYGTMETKESDRSEGRPPTAVRGVKICCYGERRLHGSERYVAVDVPSHHPTRTICKDGSVSPISQHLGMPLRLWKDPDIETWRDPPGWYENRGAPSNQDASFLMKETNPGRPGWGFAPINWDGDLGNVLAIRVDEEDLAVDDLRAICHFIRKKLLPMFDDANGYGSVQRTKQEVLDSITWDNVVKFNETVGDSDDSDSY